MKKGETMFRIHYEIKNGKLIDHDIEGYLYAVHQAYLSFLREIAEKYPDVRVEINGQWKPINEVIYEIKNSY